MAFVSLLVMTRCVANEYGVMMWGMAMVTLINTVADLGFNSANLKFIAKEGYDRSACFSSYMVIKAVLTVIMVLFVFCTVFYMDSTNVITDEMMNVCLIFLVYQVISNVQFAIFYTLDGLMMSGWSAILTIVECFIRNAILIVLALMSVDAETLSMSYVVATSVSVVISIYMAYKAGLRMVRPIYLKEYYVFALPLAVALILTSVVSSLDKVIIGLFYESIEVAYYSTAVGLIATFTTIGVSLNNVLLPYLSKNIENDKVTEHMLWSLERIMVIILGPFVAFFLVLGPQVASVLFGPDFRTCGEMIAILSIQIIPFAIAGIMTQVLYAINRGKSYLRASAFMCIIAVAGFLVLIPNQTFMSFCMGYGGIGASVAIVVAYVVFMFTLLWMVKKSTKFRFYPKIWKSGIAFLASLLLLYGMEYFLEVEGLIMVAIAGLLCEALFIIILYAMKEIRKKDLAIIWKKFRDDED